MEMISLCHIDKKYGTQQVLEDVNLTIQKGDIYGLIGKNGAGKTTIFKMILGLTNFESGQLSIFGSDSKAALSAGRKHIGFFIGKNFFDYLTARENLDYYRRMKGIREKDEVDRVLALVGLQKTSAKFGTFSMGMKQRLGIANAMLGNPDILMLDEPVNGLDPQGIADIRHLLVKLNAEYGTTIVLSSHLLSELEHTATRFGILDHGRVLREFTHEVLNVRNDSIRLRVSDYERARQLLLENHIEILQESAVPRALEDYYFELVGGDHDVALHQR
ncbi:MAG: ATP-binding cassette domain-containing protein [Peptococcaceae bacterium]|nr:ATP-binding cassette domain-containing protein [Peptococcaceae bacterium]